MIVDGLARHHRAHIRSPRRVADHARAAADERDGPMPRVLHVFHGDQLQKVPHVQAVRRGVEPDIKWNALAAEEFIKILLENRLLDKAALAQRVHDILFHCSKLRYIT